MSQKPYLVEYMLSDPIFAFLLEPISPLDRGTFPSKSLFSDLSPLEKVSFIDNTSFLSVNSTFSPFSIDSSRPGHHRKGSSHQQGKLHLPYCRSPALDQYISSIPPPGIGGIGFSSLGFSDIIALWSIVRMAFTDSILADKPPIHSSGGKQSVCLKQSS
jgi:hypothetical protein